MFPKSHGPKRNYTSIAGHSEIDWPDFHLRNGKVVQPRWGHTRFHGTAGVDLPFGKAQQNVLIFYKNLLELVIPKINFLSKDKLYFLNFLTWFTFPSNRFNNFLHSWATWASRIIFLKWLFRLGVMMSMSFSLITSGESCTSQRFGLVIRHVHL